jgi:cell division protein FtsB
MSASSPIGRHGLKAHPRQARVVLIAGVVSLVGLLLVLADPRGVRQLRKLRHDLDRQAAANETLKAQNAELEKVLKALGPGASQRALEKAVREQLGHVRDDEVVFKFE